MPGSITAYQFPTFADCVSSASCISPAPSKGFRRCQNPVNANDRATASKLRRNILSSITSPHVDLIDAELREYAKRSCCVRYHRAQVDDEQVMSGLVSRWRDELIAQRIRHDTATRSRVVLPRRTSHINDIPQSRTTIRPSEIEDRNEEIPPVLARFTAYEPQDASSMLDIISLPVSESEKTEDNDCPVCLDHMTDPARTACGHEYHSECLAQWLSGNNSCPICRAELVRGVVADVQEAEIPMQNSGNVI